MRMLRAARGPDTVLSVRGWAADPCRVWRKLGVPRRRMSHVVLSC